MSTKKKQKGKQKVVAPFSRIHISFYFLSYVRIIDFVS